MPPMARKSDLRKKIKSTRPLIHIKNGKLLITGK